ILGFHSLDLPPALPRGLEALQREIEDVKALVQTEPHGNDLRMLLFAVAASNDRFESTLVPLPPQFRAKAGHGCQVERLRRAIENNWPSLRVIPTMFNSSEELMSLASDDIKAWHLLHWLLMPHPAYPSFRRLSILNLSPLCRIMGLGPPTEEPRLLVAINYEATSPLRHKWRQQIEEPRYYAFLAVPLDKVYRFLYTGDLDIPPGEPIRLHLQMEFALQLCSDPGEEQQQQEQQQEQQDSQAEQKAKHKELCWRNSFLTNVDQRALIICELPAELDESMANSPDRHFLELLVLDSTTLKPCYLLMYEKPVAAKMMQNWPGNPVGATLPPPSRSVIKRTSSKFIRVSNFFSNLKRLLTKTKSADNTN
ncbi:hypothetical protein KR054_003162, partial [Drosophila jambulina]